MKKLRDDSGAVENRAYFIRDPADSIRDPLKKERRGLPRKAHLIKRLLIKLSGYHTKLTPFVARGPCASQGSLDQKTSNQLSGRIESGMTRLKTAPTLFGTPPTLDPLKKERRGLEPRLPQS